MSNPKTTDPDDYNPAGPVRTFMAKVQFVNAGPMPPMELPMTETTITLTKAEASFLRDALGSHEANWSLTAEETAMASDLYKRLEAESDVKQS